MNWDAIAAIAELAGAAGVVASLLYLAIQIRQSTNATRLEALREIIASKGEVLRQLRAGPEAQLCSRGYESYSELSAEEKNRFGALIGQNLAVNEYIVSAYRDGLVKQGTYNAARRDILEQFSHPGVAEWWLAEKAIFADDFQEFVDELLAISSPGA